MAAFTCAASGYLQHEAERLAPKEVIKQLRRTPPNSPDHEFDEFEASQRSPSEYSTETETDSLRPKRVRTASISSIWSSISSKSPGFSGSKRTQVGSWKIETSQSDLIASFLQTLIMSEGEKWVSAEVASVAGALREGTAGGPVGQAQSAVRKFATKQLGKAEVIAALED
ncbi:hypothetical protein PHLCEN_2v10514 [Hermanssonia centrifuga]|uniref:Uncharacterized protein n=1 Tax=Hermanssonia centrifuga TaxID=98765 RepID=A0A2R6NMM4_9APHY|nr:hypothetical protein PHLCEN_2v10514 [Hermanssonia centrifuga]